jgi:hypothetical protein
MKRTLPTLFALFCALSLSAQAPMCMRDSIIQGTDTLFWPLPYTETVQEFNLNDACIDKPYNQSVTINVPSTYLNFQVSKVSIATTGAISGLPIGITYACDPPNCNFNAGTLGCIVLYGTPTMANNAPDTFDLGIQATVHSFVDIPIEFPGQIAPGSHYYLILNTSDCLVGSYDLGSQFTMLSNAPNPFNGQTLITAESLIAGDFQFDVFDLLGQRVHNQTLRLEIGRNEFTFDAGQLSNGTYFYALSNRDGKAVRRMVVAK